MDQGNVGQAPSTKRFKRLAVKKLIIKIRGALAPYLKVAPWHRPELQSNFAKKCFKKL